MKQFSVPALCAFVLVFNACEKHPASELEGAHGGGGATHASEVKHDAPAGAAVHGEKPAGAEAHGDAPKFFPEKK